MRTPLLFWDEEEVRKKKTLVLAVAFLLVPVLLGLYAATGPGGDLIAGATPTVLPSPSAVATATPFVPTSTATATPTASATPVAEVTATPLSSPTPVPPEPTVTPSATLVPPKPTVTPTVTSVALAPTSTPTLVLTAPLAAPVITTPPDGSVLKDDQPTIAGTAPPTTTVQVYDDGTLIGTAAADAQGNWALVPDEPLEPGKHTVTAVTSDDAGGTSDPSVAVTFTVIIEHLPVTGSSSWFERWLDRLLSIAFP